MLGSDASATLKIMEEYNRETVSDIVKGQTNENDGSVNVEKVLEKIAQFFPSVAPVVTLDDLKGLEQEDIVKFLNVAVEEIFNAKVAELEDKAKVCAMLFRRFVCVSFSTTALNTASISRQTG